MLLQVADWFAPAVSCLLKSVPFFFAPPLVQLPVALAPLPPSSIIKILLVVVSGSITGCLATGICVQRIWGDGPREPSRPPSPMHAGNSARMEAGAPAPPPDSSRLLSRGARAVDLQGPAGALFCCLIDFLNLMQSNGAAARSVVAAALAASAALALGLAAATERMPLAAPVSEKLDPALIILASLASLRVGQSLPAGFTRFVPAVITSSLLTSVFIQWLGVQRGVSRLAALRAYRTASGGLLGGSGVGDKVRCARRRGRQWEEGRESTWAGEGPRWTLCHVLRFKKGRADNGRIPTAHEPLASLV